MALRVYLSGPMTNDPEFISKFEAAEKRVKEKGCVVLNPVIWSLHNIELDYDEYMTLDLAMMSVCDIVVLLPGHQNSKGCHIEKLVAEEKKMKIMELDQFLNDYKDGIVW